MEVDPKDAKLFALSPEVLVEEVTERRARPQRHHRSHEGRQRGHTHEHESRGHRESGSRSSKDEIVAHVKRLLMPAYTGKFVDKDTFKDIARRVSKWQTETFRELRHHGETESMGVLCVHVHRLPVTPGPVQSPSC